MPVLATRQHLHWSMLSTQAILCIMVSCTMLSFVTTAMFCAVARGYCQKELAMTAMQHTSTYTDKANASVAVLTCK